MDGVDRAGENTESGGGSGFGRCIESGCEWVAVPVEHAFWVGHESEDESGGVADAGDAVGGAVDVGLVAEGHTIGVDLVTILENESSLGVGVGESAQFWVFERFEFLGPDAVGVFVEFHDGPVVDEPAVLVLAEGDGWLVGSIGRITGEESELDEDLESVADPDDGDAAVSGGDELWEEVLSGVHRFDSAGGDVVAVGESTGETDEVE